MIKKKKEKEGGEKETAFFLREQNHVDMKVLHTQDFFSLFT